MRFDRTFGLAFKKVERSNGNEFFLQDTPPETFEQIGGLEREIEQIKRIFGLNCFHGNIVASTGTNRNARCCCTDRAARGRR